MGPEFYEAQPGPTTLLTNKVLNSISLSGPREDADHVNEVSVLVSDDLAKLDQLEFLDQ